MPDPKPSPWPDPFRPFEATLLRLYFTARAVRDGFASQQDLLAALEVAETAEDRWIAGLEPPKPAAQEVA